MRASLLAGASLTIALLATMPAGRAASPLPEPSCPPAADHLLVPPVGAAWIGSLDGVFEYPDGRERAVWSVEDVVTGTPPVSDDVLVYVQPACDPILSGGFSNRFMVTTADAGSPTHGNSVVWIIGAGDHVSPIYVAGDVETVYDVSTLEDARALVESGEMPVTSAPAPDPSAVASPVGPRSTGYSSDPRAVLERYIAGLLAGDCAAASAETAPSFIYGAGELCGHLTVTAASIDPQGPATPSEDEVVFSTTMTTVGGDASIPDGTMIWFYQLLRQPDGRWLIAGGGSGP